MVTPIRLIDQFGHFLGTGSDFVQKKRHIIATMVKKSDEIGAGVTKPDALRKRGTLLVISIIIVT